MKNSLPPCNLKLEMSLRDFWYSQLQTLEGWCGAILLNNILMLWCFYPPRLCLRTWFTCRHPWQLCEILQTCLAPLQKMNCSLSLVQWCVHCMLLRSCKALLHVCSFNAWVHLLYQKLFCMVVQMLLLPNFCVQTSCSVVRVSLWPCIHTVKLLIPLWCAVPPTPYGEFEGWSQ